MRERVIAELVGTAFLVMGVIGSGIMASRLSPDDIGLQLLENSIATGAVLVALVLALGGAFNPVVTLAARTPLREAGPLIAAQLGGGVLGAVVANLMFDLDAISISAHDRSSAGLWLGEVVATLGLVLVIEKTHPEHIAYAVGGYIAAAYWFTSSTSFANPAVTVARMFSDTFAGIAPSSVPMFVLMQVVGAALALLLLAPRSLDKLAPRRGSTPERSA